MVRFEKDKLVIELKTPDGEAMETYLKILRSLFILHWFVAEYGTSYPATLEATAFLSYELGKALTQMEPTHQQQ